MPRFRSAFREACRQFFDLPYFGSASRQYDHPPRCTAKMGGVTPQFSSFVFLHCLSLFVHYFLENYTREPPIAQEGVITQARLRETLPAPRVLPQVVALWSSFSFWGDVFVQKIGQNGRPGGREPPRSISFDETSRMVSV